MRGINERYIVEERDADGRLTRLGYRYPDNYNFGYDVVDDIAAAEPDRPALLWCNPEGEEHRFTFGDMKHWSDKAANLLFRWAEVARGKFPALDLLFHIPNGGKRGKAEAARFKAEGVKAGVPDLFLPVPRGKAHGLFIELKRRKGGRVSKEQAIWTISLQAQGYRAEVAKGWEEARDIIIEYLAGGPYSKY